MTWVRELTEPPVHRSIDIGKVVVGSDHAPRRRGVGPRADLGRRQLLRSHQPAHRRSRGCGQGRVRAGVAVGDPRRRAGVPRAASPGHHVARRGRRTAGVGRQCAVPRDPRHTRPLEPRHRRADRRRPGVPVRQRRDRDRAPRGDVAVRRPPNASHPRARGHRGGVRDHVPRRRPPVRRDRGPPAGLRRRRAHRGDRGDAQR